MDWPGQALWRGGGGLEEAHVGAEFSFSFHLGDRSAVFFFRMGRFEARAWRDPGPTGGPSERDLGKSFHLVFI